MKIKFDRWPGSPRVKSLFSDGTDKYGWTHESCGPMGRFGGGWRWKLGFAIGGKSCIIDLIFGSIRISWGEK